MGQTKKIIGYIQIGVGVLLLLAVIFGHKPLTNEARSLQRGSEGMSGWIDYAKKMNVTFDNKEKIEMNVNVYSSTINSLYIIRGALAVLLALSAIMILQGIANVDFGSERKVRIKQKTQ